MSHGYIYLLQDGNNKSTNIYKIGRTLVEKDDSRNIKRFKSYSKGTIIHYMINVQPKDLNEIEKNIKIYFSNKYKLVKGREWFEGNIDEMKKDIHEIINSFNKTSEEVNVDINLNINEETNEDIIDDINDDINDETNEEINKETNENVNEDIIFKNVKEILLSKDVDNIYKKKVITVLKKAELIYSKKGKNENRICIDTYFTLSNKNIRQIYRILPDRKVELAEENLGFTIYHPKSEIIIGFNEKYKSDLDMYRYINFLSSCPRNNECNFCFNGSGIQYKFCDEDGDYNYCSCIHCYQGSDWGNEMFVIINNKPELK
ncbi:MAG: GIY-YIG nuclease family protein [Micrococcales bacterium]|nr:GIY-YIG nuclease family protein [Micrococcales bacterium]